jgi:hypothetical protein
MGTENRPHHPLFNVKKKRTKKKKISFDVTSDMTLFF